ncbi:hypothetical protein AT984_17275 [Paucibacter sp. KCTC 42545]|nr:hypothetical protein AT984_17275 [Paucibacter sp. KCTC 42545]
MAARMAGPDRDKAMKKNKAFNMGAQAWSLALLLFLAACGGGGGSGAAGNEPPTPTPTPLPVPALSSQCEAGSVARLALEAAPPAGRNTELALLACEGATLSGLQWTQTAGPALNAMSSRSQALSVEPTAAGAYQFDLRYVDAKGRSFQAPVQFNSSSAAAAPALVVRGEPSVLAGGQTSLRAWAPGFSEAELEGAQVAWSQSGDASATLSGTDGWRVIIKAPALQRDSSLSLSVRLTLADGRTATGQFSLLVQAVPGLPADPLFTSSNPVSRTYPYLAQGPYAAALRDCVFSPYLSRSNPNNTCTLGQLPILGQTSGGAAPTVEQVMQRVVVSNDWMAEVFERFLREQDVNGDFRRMLAAVTAVVIGGQVRPAFYWSTTGAIYLDASYLWLTPAQRDSISEAADPRSGNGSTLAFATPWRYVLNNQHAVTSYAISARQSRSLSELPYDLGRLLYHELTHANDFLPPRVHASLDSSKRVYQAIPVNTASQQLAQTLPFFSQEMQGLASVLSFGATPTPVQEAYRPEDITRFFSQDRVNDDYSYSVPSGASVPREDAAMLVEEGMMQLRYGVLRDFAVTNQLQPGSSSADLVLNWGQRGRIGEPSIRPRLQLVLNDLLPWLPANFSAGLAAPLALRAGQTWGANLDQAALAAARVKPLTAQQRLNEQEQTTRVLRAR